MDQNRFDALTRTLTGNPTRRHLLRSLAGAGLGFGVARLPTLGEAKSKNQHTPKSARRQQDNADNVAAKKNTNANAGNETAKPKSKQGLCKKNGSKCTTPGSNCKKRFCLNAPFTIEANWSETADHDTYLFVPAENATTGPAPHITYFCNPGNSKCEEEYPFACVNKDETESGSEETTISQLLPGTYEYWVEVDAETAAGELTVALRASTGRVVRQWTNPANATTDDLGWHVFDVNGANGRVTSIDELIDAGMPGGAHDPNTDVCPN